MGWTAVEDAIYEGIGDRPLVIAINKTDLAPLSSVQLPEPVRQHSAISLQLAPAEAAVESVRRVERAVLETATSGKAIAQQMDVAINERQKAALLKARSALVKVLETIAAELPLDFWTIDLRDAIDALGKITGESVTESTLERIFSQFCIGK